MHPGGRAARRGAQLGHGVPGPLQPLASGLREPLRRARRPRPPDQRPGAQRPRRGPAPGAGRRAAAGGRASSARAAGTAGPGRGRGGDTRAGRGAGRGGPEPPPTVFSAVREVVAAMAGRDPHLGLYGAFGYDLAFQFEPVRLRGQRPGEQRDLVLHLLDEIYVLDRKRETGRPVPVRLSRWPVPPPAACAAGRRPRLRGPRAPCRPGQSLVPRPRRREARERFVNGDLFEVVPSDAFHAPRDFPRLLLPTAAAAAQPGSLRVLLQPRRGGAPGRCVARSVCPVTGDGWRPARSPARSGAAPIHWRTRPTSVPWLNSAKEESELTMCTDVDRNDKSRVARRARRAIGRRQIEMYSRRFTPLTRSRAGGAGLDALERLLIGNARGDGLPAHRDVGDGVHPGHESAPRRWYGGAVAGSASTAA